jgi:Na+-transporting methylmalonyl-CoA/oxaloacetate decarboxylase gamma subunit
MGIRIEIVGRLPLLETLRCKTIFNMLQRGVSSHILSKVIYIMGMTVVLSLALFVVILLLVIYAIDNRALRNENLELSNTLKSIRDKERRIAAQRAQELYEWESGL